MTNITATWTDVDDRTAEMVTAILEDLVRAVRAGHVEITAAQPTGEPTSWRNPRCRACGDLGRIDDGYCGCKMGRDLERVETRGIVEPATGGEQ